MSSQGAALVFLIIKTYFVKDAQYELDDFMKNTRL